MNRTLLVILKNIIINLFKLQSIDSSILIKTDLDISVSYMLL